MFPLEACSLWARQTSMSVKSSRRSPRGSAPQRPPFTDDTRCACDAQSHSRTVTDAIDMKVTLVSPGLDMSGGNRVLSIYARMLSDHGHDVCVAVPGAARESRLVQIAASFGLARRPQQEATHASHFDGLNLRIHRLESQRPVIAADLPDADVVIATWWETAEWVHLLPASKGAKAYLIQHHEVFDYLPVTRVAATYRLPFHKIVVAPWLRDVMADLYQDHNVTLVPNAVDHDQFCTPVRQRQPAPTVGFMYSRAGFKASEVAIEALRQLRKAIPDLKVVSFGHHLPTGVEFLGADIEFHLLPTQDVIRDCYSRCDVWLSSSTSEGFNLPALEAMACRTPVVSTRTGWPATAVVDGFNGFCVPVGDASALCNGMMMVLRSTRWEDLSRNAHATAEPLSWERSYEMFVRVLQELCAAPGRFPGAAG